MPERAGDPFRHVMFGDAAAGRFDAVIADFREARGLARGFSTSFRFLIMQPYRGLSAGRKPPNEGQMGVWQRCNWDRDRYSPREFPEPA